MIRNSFASKMEALPTGHSDRIMIMRLLLDDKEHLKIFSVYSPTLIEDAEEKCRFYSKTLQDPQMTEREQ